MGEFDINIDEALHENFGTTEYRLMKRFNSKKNEVFLVEGKNINGRQGGFVIKCFRNKIKMETEIKMLHLLQKNSVRVPHIICKGSTSLILEYISGEPLIDIYCKEEASSQGNHISLSSYKIINHMCSWLTDFYTLTRKELGFQAILGDPNFRNFILNSALFGIDFEEVREGEIEEDIGYLCAFALTYDKPFTKWKHRFVDCLAEEMAEGLGLDRAHINQYITNGIEKIYTRRNNRQREK